MFVFAPLLLVSSHLLAVEDSVPVFDVKKICQGPAIESAFAGRNADTCIQSENAARDQLKKSWGEFPAKDRVGCIATAKIGGLPSYVELITCLEINRELDKIHAVSSDKPAGNEAAGSRRKRR